MAITPIAPLPVAPQRVDSPDDFIVKADTWVAALETWTDETNALAVEVNDLADAADTSADIAASNANFVGNWSDQTGAANIPYSVYEDSQFWQLLNNLADVTLSQPAVGNSDWALIPFQNRIVKVLSSDTAPITAIGTGSLTAVPELTLTATRAGWWKYTALLNTYAPSDSNFVFYSSNVTGTGPIFKMNCAVSGGTVVAAGTDLNTYISSDGTGNIYAALSNIDGSANGLAMGNNAQYSGIFYSSDASFDIELLMSKGAAGTGDTYVHSGSFVEIEFMST